jgi:DUF971 family protein
MSIWDHMRPSTQAVLPTDVGFEPTHLRVAWPDGRVDQFAARTLRLECPCAACVDEWTNKRTLQPESVPADIKLLEAKPTGNYAVQLHFSDGHQSGIFTWTLLKDLRKLPVLK